MFLAGVGAAVATAAGAGSVSAQASGLDYSSDFAHETVMRGTTTISSVNRSEGMEAFDYTTDSGDVENLSQTHGLRLRPRPETDDDTVTAHNPVSYLPSNVDGEPLTSFPRDVFELDGDGNPDEDLPVEWIDSGYWSAGSGATVSEGSNSITVDATDDTATFSHSEWSIEDDERRRVLSLVLDVDSLASGAVVTFRAADSSGDGSPAEVVVDDSGDPEADDVIATTTGEGFIYQVPLGDVEPGVKSIDEFTVDVTGSAAVTLHALSLDLTSEWVFGSREFVTTDDDGNDVLETEDVTEHSGGTLSITDFATTGSGLSSGEFSEVTFSWEQRARNLPSDLSATERQDTPSGYSYEDRFTIGNTHIVPAAFDLDHTVDRVFLEGALPSDRYFNLGYSTPAGDDVETISDYQELTLTDVSDQVDASVDDPELTLSESIVGTDGIDAVIDLMLTPSETDDLTSGGGAIAVGSGGGGGGFLTPIRTTIMAIATIVGGYVAYAKNAISG